MIKQKLTDLLYPSSLDGRMHFAAEKSLFYLVERETLLPACIKEHISDDAMKEKEKIVQEITRRRDVSQ